MGKFLPISQRVEIYQPETIYLKEAVASVDMAKPSDTALKALRENLLALQGDRSQGDIGEAIGIAKGAKAIAAGRNVTNLTPPEDKGKLIKGTIARLPVAAAAYKVEPWALWVPNFHTLSAHHQAALRDIVETFVKVPASRPLLTGALAAFKLNSPPPPAEQGSSAGSARRR